MVAKLNLRKMIVGSGALAALAFAGAPAQAQQGSFVVYGAPQGSKLQVVSYRDLNLVYRDHQSVLFNRVGTAVRRVCSFDAGSIPILDQDYRRCSGDAWRGARPQISRAISAAYRRY